MGQGPLDHPRLLAIEKKLDDGELDEAQHLLAQLGDVAFFRYATTYLVTRLLYQRGKLQPTEVAQRLRDLLRMVDYFPEANAMLEAAVGGTLERTRGFKHAAESVPSGVGAVRAPTPQIELGPAQSIADDVIGRKSHVSLPSIPRAAPLPQFTPPPDQLEEAVRAQQPPEVALELEAPPLPEPPPPPAPRAAPHIPDAGRYSEAPSAGEVVGAGARRSEPPGRPSEPPALGTRPEQRSAEEIFVRSGPPPADDAAATLTLFEIASLLDRGQAREALAALERLGSVDAEVALVRARALAALARKDEALDLLRRLASAPLLDPELRAGVARLQLELGRPADALSQARRAHRDDPEPPMVRLTLAWAAVRALKSGGDPRLAELADDLLARLKTRSGPRPELIPALRAALIAPSGDAERAITFAQRALKLDHQNVDALSAIAIASARLGRAHDARQAWLRLFDASPDEARSIAPLLAEHGVEVANVEAAARPGTSVTGDDTIWEPVETALLEGRGRHTMVVFEELARDTLASIASEHRTDLPTIASVAASFFTTAPVFRDFAPFDQSLFGLARIDAALGVLYGGEPRHALPSDDYGALVLIGAYVGESLRAPHGGVWVGGLSNLDAARVVSEAGEWHPFRIAKAGLRQATSIASDDMLTATLAHPGTEPWGHRLPCPAAPPCPWDPEPLPDPSRIDAIGRALSRSVIGAWCERFAEGPLDRSIASLGALDSYLGLVAPSRGTRAGDEPWVRRVAVLTGAYLGEVLRSAAGGEWIRGEGESLTPASYRVLLGTSSEAAPIEQAFARIAHHGMPLMEYASRVVRRAG
jgi:Flp pilus assembly protein TadD